MVDQQVGPQSPVGLRHQLHEMALDANRVLFMGERESAGESAYMGIHDDALVHPEGVAEHDVGGLSPDPRKIDELLHGVRYLATVIFRQSLPKADERARFVAEEAGGADKLFEFVGVGLCVVVRLRISFEQRRSDLIDALIGALRREDCGHEQLER